VVLDKRAPQSIAHDEQATVVWATISHRFFDRCDVTIVNIILFFFL
jgi:hypothetical protein